MNINQSFIRISSINIYQTILKTYVLLFLLIGNTTLLSMELYLQNQTVIPVELMIDAAAQQDGGVKNNLQKTCWFFKNYLSARTPLKIYACFKLIFKK